MVIKTPIPTLSVRQRAEIARQKMSPARFKRTQRVTRSNIQTPAKVIKPPIKEAQGFSTDKIYSGNKLKEGWNVEYYEGTNIPKRIYKDEKEYKAYYQARKDKGTTEYKVKRNSVRTYTPKEYIFDKEGRLDAYNVYDTYYERKRSEKFSSGDRQKTIKQKVYKKNVVLYDDDGFKTQELKYDEKRESKKYGSEKIYLREKELYSKGQLTFKEKQRYRSDGSKVGSKTDYIKGTKKDTSSDGKSDMVKIGNRYVSKQQVKGLADKGVISKKDYQSYLVDTNKVSFGDIDPATGVKYTKAEKKKIAEQFSSGKDIADIKVVPYDEKILTTQSASRYIDTPSAPKKVESFSKQFGMTLLEPTQFDDQRQSANYFGADQNIKATGYIDPFAKQSLGAKQAEERASTASYGTAGMQIQRQKEEIQRQKEEYAESFIGRIETAFDKGKKFYDEKLTFKYEGDGELVDFSLFSTAKQGRELVKPVLSKAVEGYKDTAKQLDIIAPDKETSAQLREMGRQGTIVPEEYQVNVNFDTTPYITTQASTGSAFSSLAAGALEPYAENPELILVDYAGGKLIGAGAGYLTTIGGKSAVIRQTLLGAAGAAGITLYGANISRNLSEKETKAEKFEYLGGEIGRGAVQFAGFHSGFKWATTPKLSDIEITGYKKTYYTQTGGTPKGSKGINTKQAFSLTNKQQPDLLMEFSTKYPGRRPIYTTLDVKPSGAFERIDTRTIGFFKKTKFSKVTTQAAPKYSFYDYKFSGTEDVSIWKPDTKITYANDKFKIQTLYSIKDTKVPVLQDFISKQKTPNSIIRYYKNGQYKGYKLSSPKSLSTQELIAVDTIVKSKEFKKPFEFSNDKVKGYFQEGKFTKVSELRGKDFIGRVNTQTKVQQLDTIGRGRYRETLKIVDIKRKPVFKTYKLKSGEVIKIGEKPPLIRENKLKGIGEIEIGIKPGNQRLVLPRFKTTTKTSPIIDYTTGKAKGFMETQKVSFYPELKTYGKTEVLFKARLRIVGDGTSKYSVLYDKSQPVRPQKDFIPGYTDLPVYSQVPGTPKPIPKVQPKPKPFKLSPDTKVSRPNMQDIRNALSPLRSKGQLSGSKTLTTTITSPKTQTLTFNDVVTTTRLSTKTNPLTTLSIPKTQNLLLPTISKTALISFLATKTLTDIKTDTILDTKTDTILDTKTLTNTKTLIDTTTKTETKTDTTTKTKTDTTTKIDTILDVTPVIEIPPPETPPPSLLIPLPDSKLGTINPPRKEGSYDTYVKDKGKWFRANKKPRTRLGALSFGANLVDNSSSASFKIKPSKKEARKNLIDDNYFNFNRGKFNKKNGIYIEKKSKRIDTLGEIQGITAKGWLAKRNRGNKWF